MIQKLPSHGFTWEKRVDDFSLKKVDKLVKKDTNGYVLEVDTGYSKNLHKKHNELPLLLKKMKIRKVEKLVPNLKDKKISTVHIKNLREALRHGSKLKKKIYSMKPNIMLNTKLRIAAKNEFEKDIISSRTAAFLERRWKILGATKT